MKSNPTPAIAAGIVKKLAALAKNTGADTDHLANLLLEFALGEVKAGRVSVKPVSKAAATAGSLKAVSESASLALSPETTAEIAKRADHCGIRTDHMAEIMARFAIKQFDGPGLTIRSNNPPDNGATPVLDTIRVTLPFTEGMWRTLERKAHAHGACDGIGYLESMVGFIASTSDLLPLWLPGRIVQRLAAAGQMADIERPEDAIAAAVLGDLIESPDNLLALLSAQWPDVSKKRLAAVERAAKQWKADDAKLEAMASKKGGTP